MLYDKDDANKIIAFIKVIVVTIFFKRKVTKKNKNWGQFIFINTKKQKNKNCNKYI
jgi:hypothetical protein